MFVFILLDGDVVVVALVLLIHFIGIKNLFVVRGFPLSALFSVCTQKVTFSAEK